MISDPLTLTKNQIDFFDRFMVAGTRKALGAFESIFGLEIDSSDSSVEIASYVNSKKIKEIGGEPLYVVSSEMAGELLGSIHLVLRSGDFNYLGQVMKPHMELSYLSEHGADLLEPNRPKPLWMLDSASQDKARQAFHQEMVDKVTEMAKVLFNVYFEAIYMIYDLHTYHSLSKSLADRAQQTIAQVLHAGEQPDLHHLIIENDFLVMGTPIRFWCLISPAEESFQEILNRIG
jgi:hypothetical protein